MPNKGGALTIQETRYVEEAVRSGDAKAAAVMAGYSNPAGAAWKLAQRPEIVAAIQAGTIARLRTDGFIVGVQTLIAIATDEKAPKAPRVQAAGKLIDYNREFGAAGSGGALSEMSRAQLDEAREKAIAYIRSLDAPPVLDLAAAPEPAPGLFD